MRFLLFILIFITFETFGKEVKETEITTEGGIEVYKKEKFYLLKKNVQILSDDLQLNANLVKVYFNKDLYDIEKIESEGSVILKSSRGLVASGEKINFDIKNENLTILGKNSLLINNEIEMMSDNLIKVNNSNGKFMINGPNSRLKSTSVNIVGSLIEGKFFQINNINEVENLYVADDKKINIKTKELDMYARKANYDKKNNIIELFENVSIHRDNEMISGDYAKINTLEESYKVTSKKSEKVKVLLNNVQWINSKS